MFLSSDRSCFLSLYEDTKIEQSGTVRGNAVNQSQKKNETKRRARTPMSRYLSQPPVYYFLISLERRKHFRRYLFLRRRSFAGSFIGNRVLSRRAITTRLRIPRRYEKFQFIPIIPPPNPRDLAWILSRREPSLESYYTDFVGRSSRVVSRSSGVFHTPGFLPYLLSPRFHALQRRTDYYRKDVKN